MASNESISRRSFFSLAVLALAWPLAGACREGDPEDDGILRAIIRNPLEDHDVFVLCDRHTHHSPIVAGLNDGSGWIMPRKHFKGLVPIVWDPDLADALLKHCRIGSAVPSRLQRFVSLHLLREAEIMRRERTLAELFSISS